jgi:membrane protease YdiL (CAAX protease family)
MPDPPPPPLTDSPQSQPAITRDEKTLRWFEVFLVLLIAVGDPLLGSFYIFIHGASSAPPLSNTSWLTGLGREVVGLLLLGYVLHRRGRRFKDLGLHWSLWDVGTGVIVAVASYAAYAFGFFAVQTFHFVVYGTPGAGHSAKQIFGHPPAAALLYSVVNGFFEELIVRAYLMTEIIELTGSSSLAVILSVAIQFSYHLYYGWSTALSLSFMFLVFAIYYARSRRALPIIFAHEIIDLLGLIRLWHV